MSRQLRKFYLVGSLLAASMSFCGSVSAVKPAQELLPNDTRLYLSIPDVEALRTSFRKTEFGKLANDPVMKPFADDLVLQVKSRLGSAGADLGIDWNDLDGVYGGEACLARIYSAGSDHSDKRLALVLLVDVTNHLSEIERVQESIAKKMEERKATPLPAQQVAGVTLTGYQLPKKLRDPKPTEVYLGIVDDQFVVSNSLPVITNIVSRATGKSVGSPLAANPDFAQAMAKVAGASEDIPPHVRWYVEPFGYAELLKAANVSNTRRKKDMLQKLRKQGFAAIRGVGGHINLAAHPSDVLHRTFILASPNSLEKAARMLSFPTGNHQPAPAWVPRELATYLSCNWNLRSAFDHSTSLIDEIVDTPGFVDDVLNSLKKDPAGPQIDIRTELLDHLDDQILLLSDYELPISTTSERLLVAIRCKDEAKVAAALKKLWKKDPTAVPREIGGRTIWEIVPDSEEVVELDIPGAVPLEDEEFDPIQIPNIAMTAAQGFMLVATNINLLDKVLQDREPFESLNGAADYNAINRQLEDLGADDDSFRFFSRTDEEYRSAYEMIRQGKMPDSESVLGRVLNRLLGPKEKGVRRSQKLDGESLPDYQVVRRYLGPGGLFVQPSAEGWLVTGIMVSKQNLVDHEAADNVLTTAAKHSLSSQ